MTAKWTSSPASTTGWPWSPARTPGLGLETARVLAARGASVVLAVRDTDKGKRAADCIAVTRPGRERHCPAPRPDLAGSHPRRRRRAAGQAPEDRLADHQRRGHVHPEQTTRDGFELQFGTNHLGQFALTELLLEQMLPVPASRVVTVSSLAYRLLARINFGDLQGEQSYRRVAAYSCQRARWPGREPARRAEAAQAPFRWRVRQERAVDPPAYMAFQLSRSGCADRSGFGSLTMSTVLRHRSDPAPARLA